MNKMNALGTFILASIFVNAVCSSDGTASGRGRDEPIFQCEYQEGRGVEVVVSGDSEPCSECYGIATVYETDGGASRKVSALLGPVEGVIRGTVYAPGLGETFDLWLCLYPSGECYRVDAALHPMGSV